MEVACIKHCVRVHRKQLRKPGRPVEPGIPEVRIRNAAKIQKLHAINETQVLIGGVGGGGLAVMAFLKVQPSNSFGNFPVRIFIDPSL
jgi:hypothetical protein